MALSWDDLQLLSILASEHGDDPKLPMPERERYLDAAQRIMESAATKRDLLDAAKLAEADAALQRDPATRKRYLDLASRAVAAAR